MWVGEACAAPVAAHQAGSRPRHVSCAPPGVHAGSAKVAAMQDSGAETHSIAWLAARLNAHQETQRRAHAVHGCRRCRRSLRARREDRSRPPEAALLMGACLLERTRRAVQPARRPLHDVLRERGRREEL
jgi:hypothetical protein